MKNSTRKVVILENLTSPYVHQAIIVLNDYKPENENKVINDAEKVVNEYLKKNGYIDFDKTKIYTMKQNAKKKNHSCLWYALIGGCIFVVCALIAVI